ncbi:MAG: tetratricopeptide repeat protein [Gammaproteobacteria bacterium]|nr:tetratricopeptide repeat protein [Gammaproteobacteria bacterium]
MRHLITIIFLGFCFAANATSIDSLQQLVDQRDYKAAGEMGETLLAEQPRKADIKFLTAYALQMDGQTSKASAMYRDMIREYPELPEPRNNLAMIYLAKGDYDGASKLLVEAINTHNSYATAYQNLSRIYTGIASEAYRRALSESSEPAKYSHNIELAALTQIESFEPVVRSSQGSELSADKNLFFNQIRQWAKAWSDKDFSTYTGFYSTEHRPDFDTHADWVEYRRQRIMRPGEINIVVSDIEIRALNENRAIIDFKQSFESLSYSDRVKKRLVFNRTGSVWKIIDERVLSVL